MCTESNVRIFMLLNSLEFEFTSKISTSHNITIKVKKHSHVQQVIKQMQLHNKLLVINEPCKGDVQVHCVQCLLYMKAVRYSKYSYLLYLYVANTNI